MMETNNSVRYIKVKGNADVLVPPDQIILSLIVQALDKNANKAKKKNDSLSKAIYKITSENGIENKFVQAEFITIEKKYKENKEDPENFLGYLVKKSMVITIHDLEKFDIIITQAIHAGVNYIENVNLRTKKLKQYRDKARSMALKDAKEKATVLAAELGQSIGVPLSIIEEESDWWSQYTAKWGLGSQRVDALELMNYTKSDRNPSVGQIKINAGLTVSFELK